MPEAVSNLIERIGRGRTLALVAVAVVAVGVLWSLSSWASRPTLVPLLAGGDVELVSQVTPVLDEAGIPYELTAGGAQLSVAEADLARARVALARDGMPGRGRPGFELFDRPSWGMTDFTQRVNYRRALEGELERTIGQMRGVERAQVHLAMSQSAGFRSQGAPQSASVVLELRAGDVPDAGLVEGITMLVASSIDGLTSEKVTVLDASGALLSAASEPGNVEGATRRHLALRREIEAYLERQAHDLVVPVLGARNLRVRVAAEINFDRLDRTTQRVNPDETVTLSEEQSAITPAQGQVAAGSETTSATYEATRTVETFSSALGNIKRLSVAVLVNEQAQQTPLTPAQLNQIEALVRNAVGLDATRGDGITVVSVPFEPVAVPDAVEPGIDWMGWIQVSTKPLIALAALLFTFLLARQTMQTLRPRNAVAGMPDAALLAAAEAQAQLNARTDAAQLQSPPLSDAESAARMIRSWMNEG